jgi:uracil-DNA glycosylase
MTRLSSPTVSWDKLNRQIVSCDACPRLRDYCRQVAAERRKAYREWDYWGRPVANFGDPRARLLIVGLAPAAHGANRTGRMFTGDRSGEWLYRALAKAGFANQAACSSPDDGLQLDDCAITATCHCAPPDNRPLPEEVRNCETWLQQTIDVLPVRVFLALGQIAWRTVLLEARRRGWRAGPLAKFGHGAAAELGPERWLVGSYHPSQQNTFTGRLTEKMLDDVMNTVRGLLDSTPSKVPRPR